MILLNSLTNYILLRSQSKGTFQVHFSIRTFFPPSDGHFFRWWCHLSQRNELIPQKLSQINRTFLISLLQKQNVKASRPLHKMQQGIPLSQEQIHTQPEKRKNSNFQIPAKNNGRSRRRQYCANKTPNPAGIWREDVSSAITDILASGFLEGDATLHADFISLFPPSLFTSAA